MTPVMHALTSALLHFVWQGLAIGLLLWITLSFLKRNSAYARYGASCVALAVLALAPLITGWMVYQADSPVSEISGAGSIGRANSFLPAVGAVAPVVTESLKGIDVWILPLWVIGVLISAVRLAWASGHASSLRRSGEEAEATILLLVASLAKRAGVKRSIRVLMSSIAEMPGVVGWISPVVLLPAAVVVGLTPQQLEAVIAHELAHIRRRDYLVNILQSVVETLLFYHPAVWWVSSRIRYEREICCDDVAVGICGDAVCYARALACLEKMRVFKPSLAMGSANGPLFHRIQRLLTGEPREQWPSRWACAAGLLAAVFCLGFNLTWASSTAESRRGIHAPVKPSSQQPLPPQVPSAIAAPLPPAPLPVATPVQPLQPVPQAAELRDRIERDLANSNWVLLRGGLVVVHGNPADEAAAKAAQGATPGDLLWFRLGGKTYVTQDKETLDRIQALSGERPNRLVGMAEFARMQAETLQVRQEEIRDFERLAQEQAILRANMAQVQKEFQALQTNGLGQAEIARQIEEVKRTVAEQALQQKAAVIAAEEVVRDVERVHRQIESALVEAQKMQLEELRLEGELNRANRSVLELLQDAVRSGKAQAR